MHSLSTFGIASRIILVMQLIDVVGLTLIVDCSDLGLFSTKTLVEANPDHQMEVRTQVIMTCFAQCVFVECN